ncbi:RNA polymerase subunit sigma-70 [Flavonifractor sp. An82]|uniref:sigma-70 family RNA polymerase sigma factor n=1 Tax=Flavonifractor sp. An82 TaxID=1965660 RepID=UPI000B3AA4A1|nr:sigma-70 family RNA polymerase sigma factor [Flavonifractor sp. An82]OUN20639.1 RNA polymerase subunit sigma-70 [Flavonifractor sp. An82]
MDMTLDRDSAAQRIWELYGKLLHTVAASLLPGHPEDAEECVQDAVWAYVDAPEKWDPAKGSERTYLCVLVRSRALDRRRRLAARREEPLEDHAGALRAEDHTEEAALRDGLRRALAELSQAERQLFTLRFLYQWPSAEIGHTLGLSANGVDARVVRLRRKLKNLLARQGLGWSGKEDGP